MTENVNNDLDLLLLVKLVGIRLKLDKFVCLLGSKRIMYANEDKGKNSKNYLCLFSCLNFFPFWFFIRCCYLTHTH